MPVKAVPVQPAVRRGVDSRRTEAPQAVRGVDAAIESPRGYPGTLRVAVVVPAGLEVFTILPLLERDVSLEVQ